MIKLDIIAGFLGAGKTTFINKMLSEGYSSGKTVLIENEFGDISIDGNLVTPSIKMVELTSGCICCTLQGDFVKGICQIVEDQNPERILIEPTGAANLNDILKACRIAEQKSPVKINSIITIANAEAIPALLEMGGEFFVKQLQMADLLVMSSTQNLSADELLKCKKELASVGVKCPIHWENWEDLSSLVVLMEAELYYEISEKNNFNENALNHKKIMGNVSRKKMNHRERFTSLSFHPSHVFCENEIIHMAEYFNECPDGIIFRAKGFLRTETGMIKVEYVLGGKTEIKSTDYNEEAKYVIIGQFLNEEKLKKILNF